MALPIEKLGFNWILLFIEQEFNFIWTDHRKYFQFKFIVLKYISIELDGKSGHFGIALNILDFLFDDMEKPLPEPLKPLDAKESKELKSTRAKSVREENIREKIIRILSSAPDRKWGVVELAKKLNELRNTIDYNLKKLLDENQIAQEGKRGKYYWKDVPVTSDENFEILQKLNGKDPMLAEEFMALLKEKCSPGTEIEKIAIKLVSQGLVLKFFGEVSQQFFYRIGSIGAQKLGTCFACGKELKDGNVLLAQDFFFTGVDIYDWSSGEIHISNSNNVYLHPECIYKLKLDREFEGALEYCAECHLPLGLAILLDLFNFYPSRKGVKEDEERLLKMKMIHYFYGELGEHLLRFNRPLLFNIPEEFPHPFSSNSPVVFEEGQKFHPMCLERRRQREGK